jgi:ribosome-associated protein
VDKQQLADLKTRDFLSEFVFETSRSGGPGGQHANKTETRVTLRFSIAKSRALRPDEKERLLKAWKSRLTEEQVLILHDESSRSQAANKEAVIKRFWDLLKKGLTRKKKRIPTKKSRAAKMKQVEQKKKRGEIKKLRQKPDL